ncbi:MAG: PEP-CTERM sorting domain-containing protein [Planctomycetota bacterium]
MNHDKILTIFGATAAITSASAASVNASETIAVPSLTTTFDLDTLTDGQGFTFDVDDDGNTRDFTISFFDSNDDALTEVTSFVLGSSCFFLTQWPVDRTPVAFDIGDEVPLIGAVNEGRTESLAFADYDDPTIVAFGFQGLDGSGTSYAQRGFFTLDYDAANNTLTISDVYYRSDNEAGFFVVPEPTTLAVMALGLTGLYRRRRD